MKRMDEKTSDVGKEAEIQSLKEEIAKLKEQVEKLNA
jgi:polyhydroxyalkanoate synthesis regulator phasin